MKICLKSVMRTYALSGFHPQTRSLRSSPYTHYHSAAELLPDARYPGYLACEGVCLRKRDILLNEQFRRNDEKLF